MRVAQAIKPKEPRNLKLTAVVCAACVVVYLVGSHLSPWSAKRGLGLAFGIAGALAFVFEMLYPARRPRARPLGTAKAWIQAHVYVGIIAMLAVIVHAGFAWPHGSMGLWLLGLSVWTTLTGLLGVWLQKSIPLTLSEGLRVEAIYERIPQLVDELVVEADTLLTDVSEVLDRFYQQELRPSLASLAPSWGYLFDVRSGRERALEPFRRIASFVDAAEKTKVDDLMSIYTEKMELDAQYSVQWVLRSWLVLHVPTAGLLMGLVLIHVFAWIWY